MIRRLTGVAHKPNNIQIVKCPDRSECNGGHHDRTDERNRDILQLVKPRCPIHVGGLVELVRNALQRTERDDHHERKSEPHIGNDHRDKRFNRAFQPLNSRESEPMRKHEIDGAILVIKHAPPRQRYNKLRNSPGKYQNGSKNRFPPNFFLVQEECQKDSDDDMENEIYDGPYNRLKKNIIEIWLRLLRKHFHILFETDEMPIPNVSKTHV